MTEPTLSRRWVLQVGAGALLSGFSGDAAPAERALPPGLYLPETNHLAHVIKASAVSRPLANYQPRFFTPGALEGIRTMVATLLGNVPNGAQVTTDIANWIDLTLMDSAGVPAAAQSLAPAHRALAVRYYGEEAVRETETFDPQTICREGLASMNGYGAEELTRALKEPESTSARRFVEYMKARAIDGYYTSKEGLRELDYRGNSFYPESPGCTHY